MFGNAYSRRRKAASAQKAEPSLPSATRGQWSPLETRQLDYLQSRSRTVEQRMSDKRIMIEMHHCGKYMGLIEDYLKEASMTYVTHYGALPLAHWTQMPSSGDTAPTTLKQRNTFGQDYNELVQCQGYESVTETSALYNVATKPMTVPRDMELPHMSIDGYNPIGPLLFPRSCRETSLQLQYLGLNDVPHGEIEVAMSIVNQTGSSTNHYGIPTAAVYQSRRRGYNKHFNEGYVLPLSTRKLPSLRTRVNEGNAHFKMKNTVTVKLAPIELGISKSDASHLKFDTFSDVKRFLTVANYGLHKTLYDVMSRCHIGGLVGVTPILRELDPTKRINQLLRELATYSDDSKQAMHFEGTPEYYQLTRLNYLTKDRCGWMLEVCGANVRVECLNARQYCRTLGLLNHDNKRAYEFLVETCKQFASTMPSTRPNNIQYIQTYVLAHYVAASLLSFFKTRRVYLDRSLQFEEISAPEVLLSTNRRRANATISKEEALQWKRRAILESSSVRAGVKRRAESHVGGPRIKRTMHNQLKSKNPTRIVAHSSIVNQDLPQTTED